MNKKPIMYPNKDAKNRYVVNIIKADEIKHVKTQPYGLYNAVMERVSSMLQKVNLKYEEDLVITIEVVAALKSMENK